MCGYQRSRTDTSLGRTNDNTNESWIGLSFASAQILAKESIAGKMQAEISLMGQRLSLQSLLLPEGIIQCFYSCLIASEQLTDLSFFSVRNLSSKPSQPSFKKKNHCMNCMIFYGPVSSPEYWGLGSRKVVWLDLGFNRSIYPLLNSSGPLKWANVPTSIFCFSASWFYQKEKGKKIDIGLCCFIILL